MIPSQMFALGDGGSDYDIPYSLRFRSSASASLARTPAAVGTPTKWTFSCWIKRGALPAGSLGLMSARVDDSNRTTLYFANDALSFHNMVAGAVVATVVSSALFRDPSGHYHVQIDYDSANTNQGDRVKMYVNGLRLAVTGTLPGLNDTSFISKANLHGIGRIEFSTPTGYLDGYLAEMNFIDGQALGPEWFGKYSKDTDQWIPVQYIGSYGANGFYLDFKDQTSLATLCYDKSGNSNHWTSSNVSLTAGTTYDSMIDTPTNNFPVVNPLNSFNFLSALTVAQGNLFMASTGAANNYGTRAGTFAIATGKWYLEINDILSQASANANGSFGFCAINTSTALPGNHVAINVNQTSSSIKKNGTNLQTGLAGFASGDIIGIELDLDNLTCSFYKNGVQIGSTVTGLTADVYQPYFTLQTNESGAAVNFAANFGQRPFTYIPSSGYSKLCSKNLPIPSIKRGDIGFDIATYTGNGGNLQVGEYKYPRPSYLIPKSLRFRGSTVNASLSKSFTTANAADTSQYKKTYSGWFKRTQFGVQHTFFNHAKDATAYGGVLLDASDRIRALVVDASVTVVDKVTNRVIKDLEWHHLLISVDNTLATAEDRIKIYLDNERLLSFATNTNPAQNTPYLSNIRPTVGSWIFEFGSTILNTSSKLDGFMAELIIVDGQALGPTNFGEFDINGYWIPKAYSGTFGVNGLYFDFEDTSSVAALGYDKSGLGNNFSVNNISLTAGTTYDSMDDTPTNPVSALNPLTALATNATISEAALKAVIVAGSIGGVFGPAGPNTGKWYFEFTVSPAGTATNGFSMGIVYGPSQTRTAYNCFAAASVFYEGTDVAYGSILVTNDIVGVAYDLDAGWVEFYVNGVAKGKLNITKAAYEAGGSVSPFIGNRGNGGGGGVFNFGQKAFSYTPPLGHKSLALANIAEYESDLETPDLVWIKCRNVAQNHMLFDRLRDAGNYISSNLTAIEANDVNSLISFNKNGFYLGNTAAVNTLNNTYTAWMWKANGIPYSNTDGTITATVKADPEKGFSVVQYTGNGVNSSVGHGLGITPSLIIVKCLNGLYNFAVRHVSLTNNAQYLLLNSANAIATSNAVWNNLPVNSLSFPIGTDNAVNASAKNYIAYCFSEIDGYSKFGQYTGNGAVDGPFIHCGFKPRFIMIKWSSVASPIQGNVGDWLIYDTERDSVNDSLAYRLSPDVANVENGLTSDSPSVGIIDILSNGFKIRYNNNNINANGGTYVFAAFAECPTKYSTAK